MDRKRQIIPYALISLAFVLFLPQITPCQEGGQMTPEEMQQLLMSVQGGKLDPEALRALQEKGVLDKLTPEQIEMGKKLLEQKKGETGENAGIQKETPLTGVGLDLVDYVNRGLLNIQEVEKSALERYDSVTGKNYFTDEKVYDALKNDIIPGYEQFVDLLKDVKPKTLEVSQLHFIYIRNSEDILGGFRAKMLGLEKKEEQLIEAANRQIEGGRRENEKWRERLADLLTKYGIEKPAGKKEEPTRPDEEFFKKSLGPGRPSLEIFGHNLFSEAPSTFAPILAMPVSDGYIVGPGDEIKILMWGRLDERYSLEVDNEGVINFPRTGPLTVGGLTFEEVKELIRHKAEAITGVNVNVSMGKLRTIQVFVLGEVKNPGVYTVSSLAAITNALLASGGPTDLGSLRRVELKRQGKVISVIDLYDFLLKGDTSADTRLMPGDVVFLPQAGPMVSVSGNVKRPAIYELKDDLDLKTTLDLAGGLTPWGYKQRIQIERASEHQQQIVVDIPYAELAEKRPILLKDGDLVRVFPIIPDAMNAVYLFGNVLRPGQYEYKQGLRVSDIIPNVETLDKDTYFGYALIKRYHLDDMKAELIPFDLGQLLFLKDESQDISLRPLDELYVFDQRTFEDRTVAVVEGEVRKPGRYFIDASGMRLRDLIFKAGNLTRDAYMKLGHIYRKDRHTKEVNILTFNLKKAMAEDPQNNILLQDQDTVYVHSILDYKEEYTVSIKGMVHRPGDYPYASNMTVKDLILVAGNVRDAAYTKEAELVRFDIVNGKKVESSVINFDILRALENDPDHNLKLQPMDFVNIKQIPDWWDKKKTVSISGEVCFPGDYQIRSEERLSDLLKRAGGFTERAYLRGASFTREAVKKMQQDRLNDLMKKLEIEIAQFGSQEMQTALSKEDLAAQAQFVSAQKALVDKLSEAEASGRLVISLAPINELKGRSSDLFLEDGDRLYIPQRPNTVSVLGAVYNPTALVYDEDRPTVEYYLNKTGGPTDNAEVDQMYIIRADGTVVSKGGESWFGVTWSDEDNRWAMGGTIDDVKLYPGDTILVPQKLVRPAYMRDIKDITQIVYQIAVIAGITATQIFNK
jgi:polysaccharide export outer membrane protein